LTEAREQGFLGPGPVEAHLDHAAAFIEAWPGPGSPEVGVDLGSGAGLPGLVLAVAWPASRWRLVEGNRRRAHGLEAAVAALGLAERVEVAAERAEQLGRRDGWRGAHDLVTARSFGAPAVVAECAAPLLRVGGNLLVSEPPGATGGRWPAEPLALLGLEILGVGGRSAGVMALRQAGLCPDRYPRRMPHKRPLF
jgi:16S rRNA (guanine527-N7)-methyltransferase